MREPTPEEIDARKVRDRRFADIEAMIDIETALRSERGLRSVVEFLRADADKAMAEFAVVNPADTAAVIGLQARVARFTYTLDTFNFILQRGQVAEQSLRAEDEMVPDGRID